MSEMKKTVLLTFIAGVFSLLPTFYYEISEQKANLEYSVFNGPLLETEDLYKTIVSIEIKNTGKKILSDTVAIVESSSEIESLGLSGSAGLEPKFKLTNDKLLKVSSEKMHPGDKFTVSVMLSSKVNILPPSIAIRSNEVIGVINTSRKDDTNSVSLFSGLLSGLSVFMVSLFLIIKSRLGMALSNPQYKNDNLFYIAIKIGNEDLIDLISKHGGNLTYLRFADILLYLGSNEKIKHSDALSGMECLFLINKTKSSRKHIKRNMASLTGFERRTEDLLPLEEKSKNIKHSIDFRNAVDEKFDSFYL
ncbi:hypothetical protein [Aliivibrio finisterrensis]|uniref:hypothetical protein n=1 Tax=Aliivibrio finisterrensis TaxID=511998 RepID=UPI0010211242|nr:hypothetical protein [Aliivibrio finisterrensis]RYU78670.1 hypothetical protein ERW52_20290 [Aliivibrio finisterrensis]